MKIMNRIYGKIEIANPVLIELIESKPFQRLKKISQDGAPHYIQPVRDVTRFEHSIGVWYLSHKYNRTLEEQIASLLHDIPHTAFSHVIDFVVRTEKHDYHDKFTKNIILNSKIPSILERNGVEIEKVLQKGNYNLLENELPDISVDRWDYFMRDGYTMGFLPITIVQTFLDNIYTKNDNFYFTDVRLAALFSILFANFSRLIWLDPTSHGAFFLLAEAIKIGLESKYITKEDFFTNDEILLEKLKNSHNKEISRLLSRLEPGKEFEYANEQNAEFYGPNKPRYVNPFVKTTNGLQRISELVPSLDYFFKEFSANYKNLGVVQQI
ncbi:hypothetical protein CO180_03095 [candidate division WWE3 bacterium CG_4_9_14_3_um_filter_41_6]|uniref:HD/PDEase domain-containing protein n=1 Tax=candidate division WWE3 bacterium CG_4_10_14_0_2_um_filter_41_14 TaxID=1975072 RepID=A0A2M7TG65_UNCKA|nr:MAG: hypothetical protein COY32_05805 [candidate division WWE3 bacterium CG_4_10_14_0_2_um_filter_41_14]PJA38636.1 MAG: hypothetical protein CO180_03095 [candidate division WWE3 bacterium CG_4_9_14_3_um_filter_41_6]